MTSFADYIPKPALQPTAATSPAVCAPAEVLPIEPGWFVQHLGTLGAWWHESVAGVVAFCGRFEFTIGEVRGYVKVCPICLIDVHEAGVACPNQLIGDCDLDAGTVMLDRFGNCSLAGIRWRFHNISNRRSYLAGQIKPREVISMK